MVLIIDLLTEWFIDWLIYMLKFKRTSSSCHDNLSGCMNDSNNNNYNNTTSSKNTMNEVNDVKTAGGHFKDDDDVFAIKNTKGLFRLAYFTEEATGAVLKKVFLKSLQNSQEKICARVSFLIKLQASAWHRCFSVKFAKFSRTSFCIEHLRRLVLSLTKNWVRNIVIII